MPIYKQQGTKHGKQKYRVVVCYTDRLGEYKQKSKIAYGAAEAKLLEAQMQADIDETIPDSHMTVGELAEEYLKVKQHEVRETSLSTAKGILEYAVLPYFGNKYIDELTPRMLQQWKTSVSEKNLKAATKANYYREFQALMNYAVKMEYIAKNPLTKVGNFRDAYITTGAEPLRYYTPEQFKKYIEAAREEATTVRQNAFYVFFSIAYFTGLRKGEINALKWSDIEGDVIHVRRSVAQKIKGKSLIETAPKNKSSIRDVVMPKQLLDVLNEHRKLLEKIPGFTEDFRVCGGETVLGDTSLSNANFAFAEKAGLPRIKIHDFRHSHASLLANNGINIQEIARRLGHSKIEVTWNTYSHLYPREEERAIKFLENI